MIGSNISDDSSIIVVEPITMCLTTHKFVEELPEKRYGKIAVKPMEKQRNNQKTARTSGKNRLTLASCLEFSLRLTLYRNTSSAAQRL